MEKEEAEKSWGDAHYKSREKYRMMRNYREGYLGEMWEIKDEREIGVG